MLRGTTSYAAASSSIIFQGLEVGDVVEIYRICNYDESSASYSWAFAVTSWMSEKRTGQFYADLSPTGLSKMKSGAAKEFCELLLDGLRNTSTGVANLQGQSFTYAVGSGNTVETDAGYYIVLPKGNSRVYDLEWFVLEPGTEKTITYTEDNYSVPSMTTAIENDTSDRGMVNETVPMTELDDQVSVTSDITMPSYNSMYSDGKRVLTVSFVIPYGMEYVADSLELTASGEEGEEKLPDSAYTVMSYSNVQFYRDYSDKFVFFGSQDYFYEIDGNHLAGPDGTPELALEAFNEAYGTQYSIEEKNLKTVGEGGNTSTQEIREAQAAETGEPVEPIEDEEVEETEDVTEAEGTEEVQTDPEGVTVETEAIGDTSVDTSNLIFKTGGLSVVIVSLDTSVELDTLKAKISAKKNQYSTPDGWYDIYTCLSYSVSPLDKNLRAVIKESARAAAYGIRLTACMGYADSYLKSGDEILATAPRMLDDKFTLYKKTNTYSGDINEAVTQVAVENKDKVQLIYDSDLNVTNEYTEYALLDLNDEAQIAIGGIIAGEYLIVQTDHVPGFALSELSYIIESDDWQDEEYMEGNCVFDLVWLDYKTVYLPATGDSGQETGRTAGILIMLFAAAAIAQAARKRENLKLLHQNRVLQK